MRLRFLVKTAITLVTPPVVFHSFPLPVTRVFLRGAAEPQRCHCGHGDHIELQLRFDGGATAIIGGMTAVLAAAPLCHCGGSTAITAVETPRDRGSPVYFFAIAHRLYCGGTAVRKSATAVLVRCHGRCHGGRGDAAAVMAVPRRSHCGLAQLAMALRKF